MEESNIWKEMVTAFKHAEGGEHKSVFQRTPCSWITAEPKSMGNVLTKYVFLLSFPPFKLRDTNAFGGP